MKKLITRFTILLPLCTATLGFAMDAEIKSAAENPKKTIKIIAAKKIKRTKKGFLCEYCDDVFEYKSEFIVHIRKHTGERPFACTYCPKTFPHKTSCVRHEKIHAGEKYTCPHCPKMFTDDSSLRRHIKTHTDKKVVCPTCGNRLADQSNLKKHIRTHTGVKPFKCSYCSQAFSDKSAYNRHTSRHEKSSVDVQQDPVKEEDVVKTETPAAPVQQEEMSLDLMRDMQINSFFRFDTLLAAASAPDEHKD